VSIVPVILAAGLAAGLEAMVGFGTFTIFLAAVAGYALGRKTPPVPQKRALIAGLLIGVICGVFDGATDVVRYLVSDLGGPERSFIPRFLQAPYDDGGIPRTLVSCCGAGGLQPIFGLLGAWFGRALAPD
jgi:hypothetical protein